MRYFFTSIMAVSFTLGLAPLGNVLLRLCSSVSEIENELHFPVKTERANLAQQNKTEPYTNIELDSSYRKYSVSDDKSNSQKYLIDDLN